MPVNPGLCIESECRSPEGPPRRERPPADQGRRVRVDPGHGVALIGFFPNFCRAIFSIDSFAKNVYCSVELQAELVVQRAFEIDVGCKTGALPPAAQQPHPTASSPLFFSLESPPRGPSGG